VESDRYASNFAFEWTLHDTTQLDNDERQESESAFREKTGLTPDDLRGSLVLDVGCGMGRFTDVASRWGATVVGVDLTAAVDSAAANLGARPNVHLMQADVFSLPLREGSFDFVFSIGVLHHTPSTRAAFDRLPRLLKPGGRIAVWVYSTRLRRWSWTSDAYRVITSRVPKEQLYRACRVANPMYELRTRLGRRSPLLAMLAGGLLPTSMHSHSEWRVLDTFDWYSPRYQHKHSPAEVRGWFEARGLQEIRVLDCETAVVGRRGSPVAPKGSQRTDSLEVAGQPG
jgi:SAM-dependent methyltransferase